MVLNCYMFYIPLITHNTNTRWSLKVFYNLFPLYTYMENTRADILMSEQNFGAKGQSGLF